MININKKIFFDLSIKDYIFIILIAGGMPYVLNPSTFLQRLLTFPIVIILCVIATSK